MVDRGRRLSMLLSDEEHAMLQALAERKGLTASDYVRLFIRDSYSAAFGEKPSKKPKPKK